MFIWILKLEEEEEEEEEPLNKYVSNEKMNQSETTLSESMNINVNHILTFLFLLIAIIGILGNLLVIIAVEFEARMRQSLTNQLIVRVASCDFLILLFNIPDIIQFVATNANWILGEFACKFIRTTLVLAQYASVLTMCALTIERFIGIVYPLRSKFLRTEKHVVIITVVVWMFSFSCASPNLFYLRVTNENSSRYSCRLTYSEESLEKNQQIYIIHKSIESIVFYFLPLLLQIYSYSRIARRLFNVDETLQTSFHTMGRLSVQRSQTDADEEENYIETDETSSSKYTRADSISQVSTRRSRQLSTSTNSYFLSTPLLRHSFCKNSLPTVRRTSVAYNALKSRRNVIKMLFIVVLIYFISFSPQVLLFVLFDTNAIRNVPQFIQTPYFVAFTMLLVTISSASNPIVYAIFCSKFRQSFAKILRKIFCCGKNKFNYRSSQRALSLKQIPKATYRFNGRLSTDEKQHITNNGLYKYST